MLAKPNFKQRQPNLPRQGPHVHVGWGTWLSLPNKQLVWPNLTAWVFWSENLSCSSLLGGGLPHHHGREAAWGPWGAGREHHHRPNCQTSWVFQISTSQKVNRIGRGGDTWEPRWGLSNLLFASRNHIFMWRVFSRCVFSWMLIIVPGVIISWKETFARWLNWSGPGYYADPEADCQSFHICAEDGQGGLNK